VPWALVSDRDVIGDKVVAMACELCKEIEADWRRATHVGVTVRTRSFFTQVKTGKLPEVTTDPKIVEAGARAVLARFDINRPVRLLGVRLDLALD
jgi:DNA polymerase-4